MAVRSSSPWLRRVSPSTSWYSGLTRSGGPLEVVGFVHDQHVPAGFQRTLGPSRVLQERLEATDHELIVFEGIGLGIDCGGGFAVLGIDEGEPEVKAAEQLDKPLVDERFREHDKDPLGPAGELQAVEDEAGLDGFAQPDLVGEEHAREVAVGDLLGDIELVRDQIDPPADEAGDGRLPGLAQLANRFVAEIEGRGLVNLAPHQAVLRLAETDRVGEFSFGISCAPQR